MTKLKIVGPFNVMNQAQKSLSEICTGQAMWAIIVLTRLCMVVPIWEVGFLSTICHFCCDEYPSIDYQYSFAYHPLKIYSMLIL